MGSEGVKETIGYCFLKDTVADRVNPVDACVMVSVPVIDVPPASVVPVNDITIPGNRVPSLIL